MIMKTKVIISITITICTIFFILLYVVHAAIPLAKEYHFVPEWNLSLENPVTENANSGEAIIPFSLGQSLGYFTENGKLTYYKSFPSKSTISDNYFALYNTEASNIPFYNKDGSEKGIINGAGFPFIQDERIYLLQPGGNSYSLYDNSGALKWNCENSIPLTALSSNNFFTISGYSNGFIKVISNATGDTVFTFSPGGSDYPVIYGADISPNGKYIATLSGQNPQRFMITQRDHDQAKVIFHENIESEITRRTLVQFSKDGSKVFYNYKNGFGIFDLEKKSVYKFPISEKILQIEETENLLILLTNSKKHFTVYLIEKTNSLEGSFDFDASYAFIKTKDENLYVGKDNSISKISIKRD